MIRLFVFWINAVTAERVWARTSITASLGLALKQRFTVTAFILKTNTVYLEREAANVSFFHHVCTFETKLQLLSGLTSA